MKKLLISTIIFFLLSGNTIADSKKKYNINIGSYGSTTKQLSQSNKNFWYSPPVVVVCQDSNVKIDEVRKSVRVWETKGIKFKDVRNSNNCPKNKDDFKANTIFITKDMSNISGKKWGQTSRRHVWCYEKGFSCIENKDHAYIFSSIIQTSNQINNAGIDSVGILAHEIGHALGFEHVSNVSDIMSDSDKKYFF